MNTATQYPRLSVVIPMYKEQDNVTPMLEGVHKGLSSYPGEWELIVVDDGSTDDTGPRLVREAAKFGPHVRVLRFARNHGQTAAMQAGIDAARGEIIATLDGDLQNDPADIPKLVDEMLKRDLDLIQGKRINRQDALVSRKLPSKIANRLIAKITGVNLTDYGCSLKVYRARIIKQVRLYGEMHRFIPVWAAMVTSPHRIAEMPVAHYARQFGTSKYGISRTFRVILDLLTVFFFMRFQARPGHFFGSIGLALGFVGGSLMSWLLFVKFGLGQPIGDRPMLMASILLLVFSAQFITTGIVAEMLARIFYKDMPRVALIDEATDDGSPLGWAATSTLPAAVLAEEPQRV